MDLRSQPTLIRGNTSRTIEYTPEGKIIIRSGESISIPRKDLNLSGARKVLQDVSIL